MLTEVLWFLFGILLGLVFGFFGARFFIKKQLKENPPINERIITEMMAQMGRKPSKKQVHTIMRKMQKENSNL